MTLATTKKMKIEFQGEPPGSLDIDGKLVATKCFSLNTWTISDTYLRALVAAANREQVMREALEKIMTLCDLSEPLIDNNEVYKIAANALKDRGE